MRGRFSILLAFCAATAILLQPIFCACFCVRAGEVSSQVAADPEPAACPHCGNATTSQAPTNSDHQPAAPCKCCIEQHPQAEFVPAAKVQPLGDDTADWFQIVPLPLLELPTGLPAVACYSHPENTCQTQGTLRALLCCWVV